MNYELEIAFDFKNSKEYFVRYEPIELTDLEKIPEKLKNKKLYVFEKVKPKAKNIGTFLLEFLNLDFSNALHLNYFLVYYFLHQKNIFFYFFLLILLSILPFSISLYNIFRFLNWIYL